MTIPRIPIYAGAMLTDEASAMLADEASAMLADEASAPAGIICFHRVLAETWPSPGNRLFIWELV